MDIQDRANVDIALQHRPKTHAKPAPLPKSPLKLVSKATAKEAQSPVKTCPPTKAKTTSNPAQLPSAERPSFNQWGHFPQGHSSTSLGLPQVLAPAHSAFPTSAAVQELDTGTAAPALPSVQVYDEWGRPRSHSHTARTAAPHTRSIDDPSSGRTTSASSAPARSHSASSTSAGIADQSARHQEQENLRSPQGGAAPSTETARPPDSQNQQFTRQYLLSVSAPNLLKTAAPENAVAQCATLNLQVWEWGSAPTLL
jgi:hypothetical protein